MAQPKRKIRTLVGQRKHGLAVIRFTPPSVPNKVFGWRAGLKKRNPLLNADEGPREMHGIVAAFVLLFWKIAVLTFEGRLVCLGCGSGRHEYLPEIKFIIASDNMSAGFPPAEIV
jgi:hypothetical protein